MSLFKTGAGQNCLTSLEISEVLTAKIESKTATVDTLNAEIQDLNKEIQDVKDEQTEVLLAS